MKQIFWEQFNQNPKWLLPGYHNAFMMKNWWRKLSCGHLPSLSSPCYWPMLMWFISFKIEIKRMQVCFKHEEQKQCIHGHIALTYSKDTKDTTLKICFVWESLISLEESNRKIKKLDALGLTLLLWRLSTKNAVQW